MPKPTLTACMPNYNHGKYIAQAIEAVVSQSRPPDEYIILDDASTDNSPAIIESYARKYSYIRYLRNERNLGALASIERAVKLATGDYLYAGAADDYVLPGFFEKAMQMAERYPQAGSVVGNCLLIDFEGKDLNWLTSRHPWKETLYVNPESFLNDYLFRVPPMDSFVSAVIYKMQNLHEVGGFRKELGFSCDTFSFRAIGLRSGICYVNERCACWRKMPDSLCHSTLKDPSKEFGVLSESVRLMKSPEFKGLFPMDYVEKWSREYRNDIVNRALGQWDAQFQALRLDVWQRWTDRGVFDWFMKRLWWRFDCQYRRLLKFLLRRSLEKHEGKLRVGDQAR